MSRYERITRSIAQDRCVVLDGAVATELIDVLARLRSSTSDCGV